MAIPWLVKSNPPSTRNRNIPRPLPLVWAAGLPVIFDPSSFDCLWVMAVAPRTTWPGARQRPRPNARIVFGGEVSLASSSLIVARKWGARERG
jgi:hypothetical protein